MENLPYGLRTHLTRGSLVKHLSNGIYRLSIPPGPAGRYRLAQLDNYQNKRRANFPHKPPMRMMVEARASDSSLPGTWGFGIWNDPFGMAVLAGQGLRLPTLPNAAWFFYASPSSYLSLRDDLPACGGLGATFQSPLIPGPLVMLSAPFLPLLAFPPLARSLRKLGRRIIHQDSTPVETDPASWHTYSLEWTSTSVGFWLDSRLLLETDIVPWGSLGLVIWIDNQYAAFLPNGRLRYGMDENPRPAWIEIRALEVVQGTE